jgi:RNA-directed DNA polymerase
MTPHGWHFSRTPGGPKPALLEATLSAQNIATAWDRVRRNQGAAGVDGRSIRDLESSFASEWQPVAAALRTGTWQPLPVRRVSVPKSSGGGLRTLGIPTVMDRVVHQAISQMLTPLWEPRFSPHSFAYRRGRGVREALESLAAQAEQLTSPAALHLDIRQFFDRVPRALALQAVRSVADETAVIRLVADILGAGAFERGQVVPTPEGLPQGSPLSPLLANAVLHPFDMWLTQIVPGFARYADDIVLLLPARENTTARLEQIQQRLSSLGLELNTTKTQHSSLADMSFLGFCLWRDSTGKWRRRITPAAWAALEAELAKRGTLLWTAFGMDEGTPQDYLTGWRAHFGSTECPQDHARMAQLTTAHQKSAFSPTPTRVRIPYDGAASSNTTAKNNEPSTMNTPWQQTLAVWWARLRVGRLVRVGLDMDRRKNRLFPRPSALRLTILGFTLRLRL